MRAVASVLITIGILIGFLVAAGRAATAADTELRFVRDGDAVADLDLERLRNACPAKTVEVEDPSYGRRMRYRAMALGCVLEHGFAKSRDQLAAANIFLVARDGYVRSASGARLLEPDAFLAFADADRTAADAPPSWEPIGRRQVDPGPYYVVWTKPGASDPNRYPWPYGLHVIELTPRGYELPHVAPRGVASDSPAQRGFEIFRRDCIACHAINGQGGTVGPELNVPRSIVEYRDPDQLKAFIRDPASFRYTSMPGYQNLSNADLDALIAYFDVMKLQKHDSRATAAE